MKMDGHVACVAMKLQLQRASGNAQWWKPAGETIVLTSIEVSLCLLSVVPCSAFIDLYRYLYVCIIYKSCWHANRKPHIGKRLHHPDLASGCR